MYESNNIILLLKNKAHEENKAINFLGRIQEEEE